MTATDLGVTMQVAEVAMDSDVIRLREIIDELRRMRESCEPKNVTNGRYHGYSLAISGLNKVIRSVREGDLPTAGPDDAESRWLVELGEHFETWLRSGMPAASRRYDPTEYRRMINTNGAVGAAHLALRPQGASPDVLLGLQKIDRLDASIEFAALLPWFEDLFSEDERQQAGRRLIRLGFPFVERLRDAQLNQPTWTHGVRGQGS